MNLYELIPIILSFIFGNLACVAKPAGRSFRARSTLFTSIWGTRKVPLFLGFKRFKPPPGRSGTL